jgi:uncharacterized membrane protein YqhA
MLRKILTLSRYLLVVPVIGSLFLTIGVVVMGAGVIVERAWRLAEHPEFSLKAAKTMSIAVIQTIDFFLVGALGYITAIGIYSLFISPDDEQLLKRIKIAKLKDLEDKIIGVVVAAVAVAFLGFVSDAEHMQGIFHAGAGAALVIAALCLFMYLAGREEK